VRILLSLVVVLAATACSEQAEPPVQPESEQIAVPAEPKLPGMSELKSALIGGCPKVAMRLADATCTEAGDGGEFACTYELNQDEAEHSATITADSEDWKLVDAPEECSAAG
jgi:hypothetical protein